MRLFLFSLLLLICLAYPAYAAEDGLVAYYSFDGGSGTTLHDLTGNEMLERYMVRRGLQESMGVHWSLTE